MDEMADAAALVPTDQASITEPQDDYSLLYCTEKLSSKCVELVQGQVVESLYHCHYCFGLSPLIFLLVPPTISLRFSVCNFLRLFSQSHPHKYSGKGCHR